MTGKKEYTTCVFCTNDGTFCRALTHMKCKEGRCSFYKPGSEYEIEKMSRFPVRKKREKEGGN